MKAPAITLTLMLIGCSMIFLFTQLYTYIKFRNSTLVMDDLNQVEFDSKDKTSKRRNDRTNGNDDEESIAPYIGSRIDRVSDNHTQEHNEEHEEKDRRRACRVIVENKVDFHHEVLQSIVLRFPLPWHTFESCTISKPIIYDFSLFQNRFHMHIASASLGSGARDAKFLNETEFFSWKKYFEKHLQYKVFDRNEDENMNLYNHDKKVKGSEENVNIKTQAYFNKLISYEEYGEQVDAVIDATCDISTRFAKIMKMSNDFYCLLHGSNKNVLQREENQFIYKRSCFLSPMWPQSQCTFLAADLPEFGGIVQNRKLRKDTNICAMGSRNITLATKLFSSIPYKEKNVRFILFSRRPKVAPSFDMLSILGNKYASVVHELDFEKYHRLVVSCDIFLPLTDPLTRPSHFPSGDKKSTGLVPVLAAYEIAAIMHTEFAKLYRHHLSAPYEVYNDTFQSKVDALNRLLVTVTQEKGSNVPTSNQIMINH